MNNTNLQLNLENEKRKQQRRNRWYFFIIVLSLLFLAGLFAYLVLTNRQVTFDTIESKNFEEFKKNLQKVIILPENVDPSVIQVSDAENLKKQSSLLYSQVENDDVMLIYPNQLIIFRPSVNKIVNVFPVNN